MKTLHHIKQLPPLTYETFLFALVIISHVYLLFLPSEILLRWYYTDDAFYYFQVARNISLGNGITFDNISQTSGFHPFWMLVCIPLFSLAKINLLLPLRLLILLSTTLTVSGGVLLYRMIKAIYPVSVAVLGSIIWVFYWPIHQVITQSGMEAGLNGFLILLLLYSLSRGNDTGAKPTRSLLSIGILASLVILVRLDNIFLVFFLGLWLIIQHPYMRFLIFTDVLVIFFSVYASMILRLGIADSLIYRDAAYLMILSGMITRPASNLLMGLYDRVRESRLPFLLLRCLASATIGSALTFGILLLMMRLTRLSGFPRSVLILDCGITFVILTASRLMFRSLFAQNSGADINVKSSLKTWLGHGLSYFAPITCITGIYLVWHWFTFQTLLPISGQIKQWWGTLPNTIYGRTADGLLQAVSLDFNLCGVDNISAPWDIAGRTLFYPLVFLNRLLTPKYYSGCSPLLPVFFILYISVIALVFWKRKETALMGFRAFKLPVLLCIGVLLPFFYQANGYLHTREWYWLVQILATIFMIVTITACLLELSRKNTAVFRAFSLVFLTFGAVIFINFLHSMLSVFPPVRSSSNSFDPSVPFLEENTEPGARIGMTGGGITAYFIQKRTIVNLDGLMNSTVYFELMKQGQADAYLDSISLDYVYGNEEVLLDSDPYRWFFEGRLLEKEKMNTDILFYYMQQDFK